MNAQRSSPALDREAARAIASELRSGSMPTQALSRLRLEELGEGEGDGGRRFRVSGEAASRDGRSLEGLETSEPALLAEGLSAGPEGRLGPAPFERLSEGCELVRRALAQATQAHLNATRKHGVPYIEHPRRVARQLWELEASRTLDLELVAAALLHDVLEDSPITFEELREEHGERVASLVRTVTKAKGVSKPDYLASLQGADPKALALKIADRTDNLRDLVLQDDLDFARRYLEETRTWLVPLAQRVSPRLREPFAEALAAAERRFA